MAVATGCDVMDAFRYATENLDDYIFRSASYRSIWLNLIKRGTYPLNVGTTRTVFMVGNNEPTTDVGAGWTRINLSGPTTGGTTDIEGINIPNGDTYGLCYPNFSGLEVGFHEATYGPEMRQMKGPPICRKDLLFSHDPDAFLRAYIEEITKRAKREWELNYSYHHRRLSMKAVCVPDFEGAWYPQEDMGSVLPMQCPSCELTEEMLERIAVRLIEDGATDPDSNGFISWEDAGPIFSLHIGMDQSQRILRTNDALRQDYRWGDSDTLIKRIGASRVIGNFRHIINQRPRRYTCSEGVFTEVQPYTDVGAGDVTKGNFQIINPSWRSAPYEGADILSPELFVSEIVPPKNSAGGVGFNPVSYMGEWQFVTGAYKWGGSSDCVDPLEDKGQHFAEFIHAPKPNIAGQFKYGWHIIYKRCIGNDVTCVDCSS